MANMHLVTGYAGQAHITAEDICDQNISIVGQDDFVVDDGGFAATRNGNTVRVSAGRLFIGGRFVRMNSDVSLTHAAVGVSYRRTDIIACRYMRDTRTGGEEVNLVVIDGAPTKDSRWVQHPEEYGPELQHGDLRDTGTYIHEMALFRVLIGSGSGSTQVTPIATRKKPFGLRSEEVKTIRTGTATIQYSDEHARTCNVAFSGFSSPPVVLVQQVFNKNNILISSVTANGFVATCPAFLDGSGAEGTRDFNWVAIGE